MKEKKLKFDKFNMAEAFIFLAGVFMRVFRLASIPSGVYADEPPMAYSAWCIANFGVDRYLRHMPVYFQNWYSGQSPLYTYILALIYKLGGKMGDPGIIRLPSCVFSILIMMIAMLMVRELTKDRRIHIMALFAVAFCPYFIMQGRIGLDCNLLLVCTCLSFLFLIKFCNDGKTRNLVLTAVCFGISLYSYVLSYILLGLFLIMTSLYLLWVRKINVKRIFLWAVLVVFVSLPIMLFAVSVLLNLEEFTFLGLTVAPVSAGRISELSGSGFIKNSLLTLRNTLTYDGHYATTIGEFGTLYYISVPFTVAGIVTGIVNTVKSLVKKQYCEDALFVFLIVSNMVVGGLNSEVFAYRVNSIFLAYAFFLVKGIQLTISLFKTAKMRNGVTIAFGLVYVVFVGLFAKFYFCDYVSAYDGLLHSASEAIDYWNEKSDFGNVYVDYYGQPEMVLYEYPISPYEWKEGKNVRNVHPRIWDEDSSVKEKAGYIIKSTNASDCEKIENSGYNFGKKEFGYYILYYPQY